MPSSQSFGNNADRAGAASAASAGMQGGLVLGLSGEVRLRLHAQHREEPTPPLRSLRSQNARAPLIPVLQASDGGGGDPLDDELAAMVLGANLKRAAAGRRGGPASGTAGGAGGPGGGGKGEGLEGLGPGGLGASGVLGGKAGLHVSGSADVTGG